MKFYNFFQKVITFAFLILMFAFVVSCKNDKKGTDLDSKKTGSTETQETKIKDKEVENALYHGTFMKNENGFDVSVWNNTIYLLKSNPSEEEKTNHFFLEIIKNGVSAPTKDLSPKDFFFSDSLSDNFSNVLVYKYKIPESDAPFNLLIGQFNDTKRTWHTFIHSDQLKNKESSYKNEYVDNTEANLYLNEFESAFNEGYFMKSEKDFDLLLNNHTLYYIKPKGTESELKERFFLHVTYADNERTVIDFNGKDFRIDELLSKKYENFIILKKEIPSEKKIIEIGTGQFKDNLQFWAIAYQIDKLYDNMAFIYDDQYKEFIQPQN